MGKKSCGVVRRILTSALMIAIVTATVAVAPASAVDDPVRLGYAIVTPIFGDSNTLAVSQNVGRIRGLVLAQARIDFEFARRAEVPLTSITGIARTFGIALVNPSDSEAGLQLTLKNSNGFALVTNRFVLGRGQQLSQLLSQLFQEQALNDLSSGVLRIEASLPVGIAALRFEGGSLSSLSVLNLDLLVAMVPRKLTGIGGPGALLLPQVTSGDGWFTEITLTNVGAAPIVVRVDVFDAAGRPITSGDPFGIAPAQITIPPGGLRVLLSDLQAF